MSENEVGVAETRNSGRDSTRRQNGRVELWMAKPTEAVIGLRSAAQESRWQEPPALRQKNKIVGYLS